MSPTIQGFDTNEAVVEAIDAVAVAISKDLVHKEYSIEDLAYFPPDGDMDYVAGVAEKAVAALVRAGFIKTDPASLDFDFSEQPAP